MPDVPRHIHESSVRGEGITNSEQYPGELCRGSFLSLWSYLAFIVTAPASCDLAWPLKEMIPEVQLDLPGVHRCARKLAHLKLLRCSRMYSGPECERTINQASAVLPYP